MVAQRCKQKQPGRVPSQLCFDFFAVNNAPPAPKQSKQSKRVNLRPRPAPVSPPDEQLNFRSLCLLLHDLAQKNISRANFKDFTTLVRCTRLLIDAGLPLELTAQLAAPVISHDRLLVQQEPHYRRMRTAAIAGLATVADLNTKAPARGSADYQQGMRDAFQKASEIAALFLEDFLADTQKENGV